MEEQTDLLEQYRQTLELMRSKVESLREEKALRCGKVKSQIAASPEFQKLQRNIESVQENIQAVNLQIIKEKNSIKELKTESEHDCDQVSEAVQNLQLELDEASIENEALRKSLDTLTSGSKLAQLEQINPKLFAFIKKIIGVEQMNIMLKAELTKLEQERNIARAEYYSITKSLGQETKLKIRIRETEKELEKTEDRLKHFRSKIDDLESNIEREKANVAKSEVSKLMGKCEELKEKHDEGRQRIEELLDEMEKLDSEIEIEKKCDTKSPLTNIKQEIKKLENDITAHAKEIKARAADRKRLQELNEAALKEKAKNSRQKTLKNRGGSLTKDNALCKTVSSFSNTTKRNLLVEQVTKSMAKGTPQETKLILRHIGSQDQGITTKLVNLNRADLLQNFKNK